MRSMAAATAIHSPTSSCRLSASCRRRASQRRFASMRSRIDVSRRSSRLPLCGVDVDATAVDDGVLGSLQLASKSRDAALTLKSGSNAASAPVSSAQLLRPASSHGATSFEVIGLAFTSLRSLKKHTHAWLLCAWIKTLDSPKSGRKQPRTIRETIKEEYSNDNNDNSVSIHESFVFADEKSNL